jgi:site-specific DNA recombinase
MGKKLAQNLEFRQTPSEGKKAALYIRVSSNEFLVTRKDERAKGIHRTEADIESLFRESVRTQKEDAIAYCKKQHPPWDYEIYDEDCDISGTLDSDERPGLERLLKDISQGTIHTVVIRDISRFARNMYVLERMIKEHLFPAGVNLIGMDDGISIATPMGKFLTQILGAMAERQISEMRVNTMRNRYSAAKHGTLVHAPYTYGFRSTGPRNVAVVPEEARVVKTIFKEYVTNKTSTTAIADMLNAQKDKAPTRWGSGIWLPNRIHTILHNPRYIGKINYRDLKMLPSPFPPIIEKELWDGAQKELKRRGLIGPRTQSSINLLTGLLKCSHCIERQKKDPNVKTNMFCMTAKPELKYYDCQARHMKGKKVCLSQLILRT